MRASRFVAMRGHRRVSFSCCAVAQDWSFGTSPYLTASDYEAPARFPEFATRSVLSQNIWAFTIKESHLPSLNRTSQTQFRVRATLATFTNHNGASWRYCALKTTCCMCVCMDKPLPLRFKHAAAGLSFPPSPSLPHAHRIVLVLSLMLLLLRFLPLLLSLMLLLLLSRLQAAIDAKMLGKM